MPDNVLIWGLHETVILDILLCFKHGDIRYELSKMDVKVTYDENILIFLLSTLLEKMEVHQLVFACGKMKRRVTKLWGIFRSKMQFPGTNVYYQMIAEVLPYIVIPNIIYFMLQQPHK